MSEISKITLPSGTTYDIKDAVARKITSGAIYLCGSTTTSITDGSATPTTVTIPSARTIRGVEYAANSSYSPVSGDAFFKDNKEFVWDGAHWNEFGDMSGLGALAYKDNGSVTFTPSGTVTFTGASTTSAHATVTADASDPDYTPSGTVGKPTLTKGTVTSTGKFTPEGTVSVASTENKTATVSPASSGDATYTPAGSISAPTISVSSAGATTTIKNPTANTVVTDMSVSDASSTSVTGELVYCSVSGETLTLKKFVETTGASISTENTTVKTGDASYSASQPSFTGTGVRLVTGNIAVPKTMSFGGTEGDLSVTTSQAVTDVAAPSFSGSGVDISVTVPDLSGAGGSFTGAEQTVNVSFGTSS